MPVGKRGIAYRAGLYVNHGGSLDARNRAIAASGPAQHMAVDRKFTTSKSPGVKDRAGGTAESAGARAIQGGGGGCKVRRGFVKGGQGGGGGGKTVRMKAACRTRHVCLEKEVNERESDWIVLNNEWAREDGSVALDFPIL